MNTHFSTSVALVVGWLACCGSEEASRPEPGPASNRPNRGFESKQSPAQKGPAQTVLDPTFELRAIAAGPYTAGKLGQVVVTLKPRGGYHINQEFPTALAISAPKAISVYKARLGKTEAAHFDKRRARFDIPLTPVQPGSHRVRIEAAFAVCTPKTCIPEKRTLALTVAVE